MRYVVLALDARRARGDDAGYVPGIAKEELARRHGKEKLERDLESVQELERLLEIGDRWTLGSPKWMDTVVEIKKRKYQLALDALELLIVERIFELPKMNQSQTGTCSSCYVTLLIYYYRIQNAQTHRQSPAGQIEGCQECH